MRDILIFVSGAAIGAAMALLIAPESGEQLRNQISDRAAAERDKLGPEVQQTLAEIQARVEALHEDVGALAQNTEDADADTAKA